MKTTQRIALRLSILFFLTAIPVASYCLPEAGHVQEYFDETKLMKDFFNLSIKPHETISYWINQLIGIIEKKHDAKELSKKLKLLKNHPEKVFKLLASTNISATFALRNFIYNFGVDRAQRAVEKRLACGTHTPLNSTLPQEPTYRCSSEQCEVPTVTTHVPCDIPVDDERLSNHEMPSNDLLDTQDHSYFTAQNYCAASLVAIAALCISYVT